MIISIYFFLLYMIGISDQSLYVPKDLLKGVDRGLDKFVEALVIYAENTDKSIWKEFDEEEEATIEKMFKTRELVEKISPQLSLMKQWIELSERACQAQMIKKQEEAESLQQSVSISREKIRDLESKRKELEINGESLKDSKRQKEEEIATQEESVAKLEKIYQEHYEVMKEEEEEARKVNIAKWALIWFPGVNLALAAAEHELKKATETAALNLDKSKRMLEELKWSTYELELELDNISADLTINRGQKEYTKEQKTRFEDELNQKTEYRSKLHAVKETLQDLTTKVKLLAESTRNSYTAIDLALIMEQILEAMKEILVKTHFLDDGASGLYPATLRFKLETYRVKIYTDAPEDAKKYYKDKLGYYLRVPDLYKNDFGVWRKFYRKKYFCRSEKSGNQQFWIVTDSDSCLLADAQVDGGLAHANRDWKNSTSLVGESDRGYTWQYYWNYWNSVWEENHLISLKGWITLDNFITVKSSGTGAVDQAKAMGHYTKLSWSTNDFPMWEALHNYGTTKISFWKGHWEISPEAKIISGKEGGLLEPGQFWKYQIEGDNTWIEDPTLTVTDMELETIVASIKLGLEQIRVYHVENNI